MTGAAFQKLSSAKKACRPQQPLTEPLAKAIGGKWLYGNPLLSFRVPAISAYFSLHGPNLHITERFPLLMDNASAMFNAIAFVLVNTTGNLLQRHIHARNRVAGIGYPDCKKQG